MKLHLPKALAAAVMALFAIPNALADTVTVTVDGTQYAGTTVLTSGDAPTDKTTNFLFSTGSEYTIQNTSTSTSHWVSSMPKGKTLIAASATYETLDESGETATITSSATPLFFDTGNKGNIEVLANIVIGRSAASAANDLRFWSGNSYCSILKGDLTLVGTTARIYNQEGTQYLEGSIKGLGKTLNITGNNEAARLRLSGGGTIGTLNLAESGASVTLSATKHDGTTEAASKEYTITTLNSANSTAVLTVESGVTLNLTNYEAGKLSNEGALKLTNFNGGTLTNSGTFNLTNLTSGTLRNEGTLNLGGSGISATLAGQGLDNAGTLNVLSGTAVNLDTAWLASVLTGEDVTTTVADGEGQSVTNPANGFGKISSFELSSLISGTVSVESGVTWAAGGNTLTYSEAGGTLSYGTGESLTSTIYQINVVGAFDPTTASGFTGATSVVVGAQGTVSLSNAINLDITVNQGATLDINGKKCEGCDMILDGGTLTNNSTELTAWYRQLDSLSLKKNSSIDVTAGKSFGLVASGWNASYIDLGGCTLTKTGDGEFIAVTTNLRGSGTLKIAGGTFNLGADYGGAGSIGHADDTNGTNIWFTGGTLASSIGINLNRDVDFKAAADAGVTEGVTGTITAALALGSNTATFISSGTDDNLKVQGVISGNGKVAIDGDGTITLSAANTYSGGTTLKGGTVETSNATALGTGALSTETGTTSTVIVTGADALTITGKINMDSDSVLNLQGNVTVESLIDASSSNTKKGTINLVSGTTTAESRIWLSQNSKLNIEQGAKLVASGFSYSGNKADTAGSISAIGSQEIELVNSDGGSAWGHNTNKINTLLSNLDVEYSGASASTLNANMTNVALSTKAGAGKLTLAREGGVSLNSLTANSDVELSTATTVTGATSIAEGTTVTVSGAGSSLASLSGGGTLSSSTDLTPTDGSGFTGTLEATGGTLSVSEVGSSLASVAASNGGNVRVESSGSLTAASVSVTDGSSVSMGMSSSAADTDSIRVTTLSGLGTLSGASSVSVDSASGFTGTLKATGGTLSVTQVGATLAGVKAEGGTVNLLNTSSVSVTDVVIGAGKTVGVYSGDSVPSTADTNNEGALTVTNLTVDGSGATLNANLVLSGSLTLGSALTMGSTLTLGSGITLTATDYVHINNITKDTEITLFSSVDSVTYGTGSTSLTSTEVDASNVFSHLNTGDFTIRFDNGDVILKANNNVPEPTTATLSLLALMGLAARRRRKAAK